ncbi:unnamed protein product [Lymnaea stagnalis]|uniref:Uncharacterized protein n=1 Tax=Lymnaea stagnalis TaxID=6523 RepID=A0AAV2I4W5_LYMST
MEHLAPRRVFRNCAITAYPQMAESLNFRDLNVVLRDNPHRSNRTDEDGDDIDVHPEGDIDLSTARGTVRNPSNVTMADRAAHPGSTIVITVRACGIHPTVLDIRCSDHLQVLRQTGDNQRDSATRLLFGQNL